MSVFLIGQIQVHDRDVYQTYSDRFLPVLKKYEGELLTADDHPVRLEGKWQGPRTVLVRFPSKEKALAWYSSPEYTSLIELRDTCADANIVMVDSLPAYKA